MPIAQYLWLALAAHAASQGAQNAPVAAGSEYLAVMPVPGLVSHTRERPGVRETQWLPAGQTFDTASRLVTIERISGAAGPEAPMGFISGLTTCFSPCPGDQPAVVNQAPVGGRPAARVTIVLPINAAHPQPRTVFALAVSGEHDLHTVAMIIRGPLSRADRDFAEALLRSATLCTPASSATICRPQ